MRIKKFILEAPLPGGCLGAWPGAHRVLRLAELVYAKNVPLSLFWQSPNPAKPDIFARIRNLCGSSSYMTRAGSAFASRKLSSPHLTISRYLIYMFFSSLVLVTSREGKFSEWTSRRRKCSSLITGVTRKTRRTQTYTQDTCR